METFSRGTLDPWWVTGFCDGEASFTFSRSNANVSLYFAVKLTATDEPILLRLQDYFGVGKIYNVRARAPTERAGATKTASLYRVTKHDELPLVTRHFDAYPLQTEKAGAYKIWRAMVEIKATYRGRDGEALKELAYSLSAAQARNRSWR
ncbi:MAG: hypothetical protein H0T46_06080 [Deltaproteobacteria bacterium]|nr:hypothetical protein [Deltaproteobacteria bacterium]